MKKVIMLVMVSTLSLGALTYNGPGTGGVTDGYLMKNERAVDGYIAEGASDFVGPDGANLDSLFVTWDENYLYIFLTTNNTASWDVAYGFGIDNTGSSSGYTGGDPLRDAWNRKIGFDNGYNIEYEIYFWWEADSNKVTSAQLCSWDGSSWSYTNLTEGTDYEYTGGTSGLQTLEIKIALSDIGTPSNIAISTWVAGGDTSSAVDAIPSETDVADSNWTDDDYVSSMFAHDISSGRTPNYFMILDGNLLREGYQTDEIFYTTSDKQAYVTWDNDSLYIGYIFADLSGDYDLWVYFDVDPQKTKNFGQGIDIDATVSLYLPFLADYGVQIVDGSTVNLKYFDGSDWADGTFNGNYYAGWSDNGTTEISIPWSDIGTPDTFYMVIFLFNNSDSKAYGIAPGTGNTDGTDDIANFIGIFKATSGIAPSQHVGDTNHIMEIYSDGESGSGTLRDAIETANGDADRDTAIFRVDATITLNSALPRIVHDMYISGDDISVTIDGNSKTYDGFVVSTDSLNQPITRVDIENLTIQNANSALRVSVANGSPIDTLNINGFYVDGCINGIYTGLVGDSGTAGGAYDDASIFVTGAYMTNFDDYGIYVRNAQSGKIVRLTVDDSYVEGAGDADNEAGLVALDNVGLTISGWSEFRGNYWGILLWNTTSAEAQYDTLQNIKIDTSYYHGIVVKREAGDIHAYMIGDSIFNNGALGASDDAGVIISAFSDLTNNKTADIRLQSSKIFDDAGYQDYGVIVTDWVGAGDHATDVQIGDYNEGNEIFFNGINGIQILTDRARGLNITYNNIHDNGTHGIYIAQADSVLIEKDTITDHSGTNQYGVYIDGAAKSNSDYNKITQCKFENNSYGIKLDNSANSGILTPQLVKATLNTDQDFLYVEGNYGPANGQVEVYIADERNGKTYLGTAVVDASGNWNIQIDNASSYGITDGTPITALGIDNDGNTSEFAAPTNATSIEEGGGGTANFSVTASVFGRSLILNLNVPSPTDIDISVIDIAGRLVTARKLENIVGHSTLRLGLPHSGVYFLRVKKDGELVVSRKMVAFH